MFTSARKAKIKQVVSARQEGILVFEDMHDPHNVAAVLRSADAFGFGKAYFIFEKEQKYNPRQVGKTSSSSANKWLDFKMFSSTRACFEELKSAGFKTYTTVVNDSAQSLFKTQFREPKIALLFGNEHQGLSDTAVQMTDYQITVPMQGMVESLNLSVAATLCMYEVTRQRIKLGMNQFRLSEMEQEKLVTEFLKK